MNFLLLLLSMLWPAPSAISEELSALDQTGVMVLLFETSLFEPCNSDERWWLDARGAINAPFYARVDAIDHEFEEVHKIELGSGSPTYFLNARGRVSEIGEHGHLGQYHRKFDVTSFSELRLATPEEQENCLTSGFFRGDPATDE